MRAAILASVLLSTGACTDMHQAALAVARDRVQTFNDSEAAVFSSVPCAMTIGAYWRLPSEKRRAINSLCGE